MEKEEAEYHEGLFVDIFPYDFYQCSISDKTYRRKKVSEFNYLLLFKANLPFEEFSYITIIENLKRGIAKGYRNVVIRKNLNGFCRDRQIKAKRGQKLEISHLIGYGSEIGEFEFDRYIERDIIFPLKDGKFEDINVNMPNDGDGYLKTIYGENYMDIPKMVDRYNHNKGIYIYKNRD